MPLIILDRCKTGLCNVLFYMSIGTILYLLDIFLRKIVFGNLSPNTFCQLALHHHQYHVIFCKFIIKEILCQAKYPNF